MPIKGMWVRARQRRGSSRARASNRGGIDNTIAAAVATSTKGTTARETSSKLFILRRLAKPASVQNRITGPIRPSHSYHFQRWQWYEWLGLIGPVILFWTLAGFARRRKMNNLELVSRAVVPFVLVATAAAIVLSIPPRFEALARLEPLRCLALAYMLLIVIGGGLLGQYILHARIWRWLVGFVPLSLGVYFAQRALFPASTHIEWPWTPPRNQWAQAFEWIRGNTPVDALFALDSRHMELPGEDENGFRARAERRMLADLVKDKGACSMFPPLSVQWLEQVEDQKNWKHFHQEDFERLRRKYGVSWVVLEQPGLEERRSAAAAMECPYENSAVRVCRLD